MTVNAGAAAELGVFCRRTDIDTEDIINFHLKTMAKAVDMQQRKILDAIKRYRDQLPETPSVNEFYDLFNLLVDNENQFSYEVSTSFLSEQTYKSWCNRMDAPTTPTRRNIMLTLLDAYLERCLYNGLGRIAQSLQRTGGGELLHGDWTLPVRSKPEYVHWQEQDTTWRVVDVVLPEWLEWHDRCGNSSELRKSNLYGSVADFVQDLMVVDLLKPPKSHENANLPSRLQKLPGVGGRKAREIIAWLKDRGFKLPKPYNEVDVLESDKEAQES